MTKVGFNQNSIPYFIAQNLDAKDGKADGKISASVWNEFVKGKGGKEIKNSITLDNAARSISSYLSKNSIKTGKSREELGVSWFQQDLSVNKKRKSNLNLETFIQNQERNEQLKPNNIEKSAKNIVNFVTGKSENFVNGRYNAAHVFLKASEKFKDGKLPKTLGTQLYLADLYLNLLARAKKLGISTNYQSNQKFADIDQKLIACRYLASQIVEKEKTNKA